MMSSRIAGLLPCCSRKSSCERAQSRGMNEFPSSASAKLILAAKRTGSLPRRPVTMISPCWSLPVGQIAADENLLRAGGDVRQPLGIEGRDLHAAELDGQIADSRPSDFIEPLESDRLRRLLAADRPSRAAADCGDPLHHGHFADVADGDAVQRPRRRSFLIGILLAFLLGLLIGDHLRQSFDERGRIAVGGSHDPVADVHDLSAGRRLLQHGRERLIEIRPAERNAAVEKVAGLGDVVGRRRERLGRRPSGRHVAGREHELVPLPQRREDRGHEFRLLLPFFGIHRGRRIAEQHDFERSAVGRDLALPIAGRRRRRKLHEQIAVVPTAMRHDDHVGLPAVDLADDLEIAFGRVFLGGEFDRRRMRGLLNAHGMRRAGHALERNRRFDRHLQRQLANRLHPAADRSASRRCSDICSPVAAKLAYRRSLSVFRNSVRWDRRGL